MELKRFTRLTLLKQYKAANSMSSVSMTQVKYSLVMSYTFYHYLTLRRRIYITRPTVFMVKLLVEQIKSEKSIEQHQNRLYTVVMVPRKVGSYSARCGVLLTTDTSSLFKQLYVCEKILEEEGVYGMVTLENFPFDVLPIDTDILSMELNFFFTSYFLVSCLCRCMLEERT